METRIMEAARTWLIAHQDTMRDELIALCNLNSSSDNLAGLATVETFLEEYFSPLGLPIQKLPLPVFAVQDDYGNAALQSTTHALRWDWVGEQATPDRRLLLTIHYDTVYGKTDPFQRCVSYEVEGEARLRGPGVIDAKGGIVVMRWALMAAMRFLKPSSLNMTVILTPDEEIGSPASTSLWKEIAPDYQFAMLYEPTLADGAFVHTRKGTGTYTLIVRGKAAHSGRNFHQGKNAIVHASRVAIQIDALNNVRPGVTFNVGRIRGGDAVNVVPDMCVVRVNVRVNDDDDRIWAEKKIQQVVDLFQLSEVDHSIALHGGIHSAPKTVNKPTEHWMRELETVAAVLGQPVTWRASGGASDGNKLAGFGVPNLDTFGPEGDALHSDKEWVRVASLPTKAALSLAMIDRFHTERECLASM
ncbi:hydrolase [Pirellula sp. SH-Sr6A]|uniref:hydrolase n=1 Tax=Pirellula sp. SH-Sr6A TaxID=1632865 RepID=UPI0011BA993F|nr:hydrolase [Pirellula sp. SH-Sr6A]